MKIDKQGIEELDRKYRLNLINSLSGIKSANLIGTSSKDGRDNVAIFSSVVHIGSSPAHLGFIMRPQEEHPSDTFRNIQECSYYTINHVAESFIEKAHCTSAKLDGEVSEFERMNLGKEFLEDFEAPFVVESSVKIGMKHVESIPLFNGCYFVIGSVELVIAADHVVNDKGQLDLSEYACAGISGLNTYYGLKKLAVFPYVRNEEIPDFK